MRTSSSNRSARKCANSALARERDSSQAVARPTAGACLRITVSVSAAPRGFRSARAALFSSPMVRAFRRTYPQARLTWLAESHTKNLIEHLREDFFSLAEVERQVIRFFPQNMFYDLSDLYNEVLTIQRIDDGKIDKIQ